MKKFLLGLVDTLCQFIKFFVFGVSLVVAIIVSYVYPIVLIGALLFAGVASIIDVLKKK